MFNTLLWLLTIITNTYCWNWIQVTQHAEWSPRGFFSAISYSDKIVILSGAFPNISSVWDSSNGNQWHEDTTLSGISTRFAMSSVTINNRIISMGGCNMMNEPHTRFNDVWMSDNGGITWNQIVSSAPWPARCFAGITVLNNKSILLMGGYYLNGYLNDVWRSDDFGMNWELVTNSSEWNARDSIGVLEFNENIFAFGGHDGSNVFYNDVWKSNNGGETWIEVQSNAEWSGRRAFGCVVWNDTMVIMGGGGNVLSFNDVWISRDGIKWNKLNTTSIWNARQWFAATVLNENIFVLGGMVNNSATNDVWMLTH